MIEFRAQQMSLSSLLTSVVHGPAHDGETRAGVAMRTLDSSCFASAHTSFTLASVVASVDDTLAESAEERVLSKRADGSVDRTPEKVRFR